MSVEVTVSHGELLDKITILEIKRAKVVAPDQRSNIEAELAALERVRAAAVPADAGIADLVADLAEVNGRLWDVEDAIRDCERRKDFGDAFVALARSVYRLNDRRAEIKRALNDRLVSGVIEEKLYRDY